MHHEKIWPVRSIVCLWLDIELNALPSHYVPSCIIFEITNWSIKNYFFVLICFICQIINWSLHFILGIKAFENLLQGHYTSFGSTNNVNILSIPIRILIDKYELLSYNRFNKFIFLNKTITNLATQIYRLVLV